MQTAQIVAAQTVVMFLYMLMGFCLSRSGKITEQGSKDLATLLVWLIIPIVIINSFCVPFTAQKMTEFIISFLLCLGAQLFSILVARLVFKKAPIDNFSAAFCNAGFVGIPLVTATFGSDAVFYLVSFVALLNILQWTYGVDVLTGKKTKLTAKSLLLNPIMVGILAGLFLFFTVLGGKLPGTVATALKGVASMNGPVAMLVMGCYMAKSDLKAMVTTGKLYCVSAVRLLLIPVMTILILALLPLDRTIVMTVVIAASTPVGANVAVYAQLHDLDYPYACQCVALSTILSVLTLPLLMILATALI